MEDRTLVKREDALKHTGAQMEEPRKKAIIEELAKGTGIQLTARKCGTSEHTVMAIRDQALKDDPKFCEVYYRTRMPAKLLHIAGMAVEQIEKKIEQLPAGVLPVAMGVAIDKYLALSGQATSITEHRHVIEGNGVNKEVSQVLEAEILSVEKVSQ